MNSRRLSDAFFALLHTLSVVFYIPWLTSSADLHICLFIGVCLLYCLLKIRKNQQFFSSLFCASNADLHRYCVCMWTMLRIATLALIWMLQSLQQNEMLFYSNIFLSHNHWILSFFFGINVVWNSSSIYISHWIRMYRFQIMHFWNNFSWNFFRFRSSIRGRNYKWLNSGIARK